jgi:hypothetical protein
LRKRSHHTADSGNLYHIGDRVKICSVTGDVLDISLMRTMVMEIGEWVQDFEREPDITVASATFEIVGFPPIQQSKAE